MVKIRVKDLKSVEYRFWSPKPQLQAHAIRDIRSALEFMKVS